MAANSADASNGMLSSRGSGPVSLVQGLFLFLWRVFRRIWAKTLWILVIFFGITVISFWVIHLAPGSPTDLQTTLNPMAGDEARQRLERIYGLDQPIHVQYVKWISRLVRFDFGQSMSGDHRPVWDKIKERLPLTFGMNIVALVLTLLIATPIGVASAYWQGRWFDKVSTVFVFIGFAMPGFWLALLLMLALGIHFPIFPISGLHSMEYQQFGALGQILDVAHHLALPIFIYTFGSLAGMSRFMRSSMLEVLRQDYILTARAKGLATRTVVFKHAMRNALLPVITILGLSIPGLIGGSVIIESIFALPGLGQLFYQGIMARDYPLIMGSLVLGAVLTLAGNLIADLSYGLADPRIRSGARASAVAKPFSFKAWLKSVGQFLSLFIPDKLARIAKRFFSGLWRFIRDDICYEFLYIFVGGILLTLVSPSFWGRQLGRVARFLAAAPGALVTRRFWSRYGLLVLGAFLVLTMSLLALLATHIAPYDPTALDVYHMLEGPSSLHPLGTDSLGRDILSRMLHGARVSLWVGFVAVGISVLIGLVLGLISGYFGGLVDEIIMRGVDIMLCFPSFFLILAVIAFLEPSLTNIMVVIGLTSWMGVARLVRAETLSLRERDFVQAAKLTGAGTPRILGLHVLPNAIAPVLVSATLGVAGAILVESSLSFLGLGVQPPDPSWGNMLMEGKDVIEDSPWLSLFPGMAILITVLGYNLLGESLRDLLDPRLKR